MPDALTRAPCPSDLSGLAGIGVVAIGRNEGPRLAQCLDSVLAFTSRVIYVDSGSVDDSIALATGKGVMVVSLDSSRPFSASRSRNEGFARLLETWPEVTTVQFVDGDCEILDGWLTAAADFLASQPQVAVVCGQLSERSPERSVYNRLCDAEWKRPPGETRTSGGIAMMTVGILKQVGGFNETLIAGEEAELCARIRRAGGIIWCLERPMALHDAAILRFGQWWLRTKRTGFGNIATFGVDDGLARKEKVRRLMRPWLWWFIIPAIIAMLAMRVGGVALMLALVYPAQIFRDASRAQGSAKIRMERGFFLMLGKIPELAGQVQCVGSRLRQQARHASFDYKR